MDSRIINNWYSLLDSGDLDAAEEYFVDYLVSPVVKNILKQTEIDVEYDVLVTLVGFTPDVNVIGYNLIKPKQLVLLCSEETIPYADKVHRYCDLSLSQVDLVVFKQEGLKIYDIFYKIRDIIDKYPSAKSYLFDVTGGKKIMGNQMQIASFIMNKSLGIRADVCYIDYGKYLPKYRKPDPETIFLILQTDILSMAENIMNPNSESLESKKRLRDMICNPQFYGRNFTTIKKTAFMLMPFNEPWSDRIYDSIKEICKKEDFEISRAGEFLRNPIIVEGIWQGINESEIIIADITSNNANVLYEIGITQVIGKPLVIITQSTTDIPFDLKGTECLVYSDDFEGFRKLQAELPKFLQVRNLVTDKYYI